jgi:hypothetical protein
MKKAKNLLKSETQTSDWSEVVKYTLWRKERIVSNFEVTAF